MLKDLGLELKIRQGESGKGQYVTTEINSKDDSDDCGAEVLGKMIVDAIGNNHFSPDIMETLACALFEIENEHHGDTDEGNELQAAARAFVKRCEKDRKKESRKE